LILKEEGKGLMGTAGRKWHLSEAFFVTEGNMEL
jgi:hypothetical protein